MCFFISSIISNKNLILAQVPPHHSKECSSPSAHQGVWFDDDLLDRERAAVPMCQREIARNSLMTG